MLAQPPTFTKSTGRYLQSFTKKPGLAEVSCSVLSISTNDRVVISRQDRTGWAIAIGTVTEVFPGPGVVVLLDKAVVCDCHVLYTVDQVSGHSGGMANHNLADLCASGSERYICKCLVGHSTLIVFSQATAFARADHRSFYASLQVKCEDQRRGLSLKVEL